MHQSSVVDDVIYETPVVSARMGKDMSAKRRTAIEFIFSRIMESPHPDVWQRDGVVVGLMKQLKINAGSSAEVKKVLHDSLKVTKEKPYDPFTHQSRRVYKKSGKEDMGSIWARAWLAQCINSTMQLRLCKLNPNSDEVILGHTSKYEVRISRNTYDNEPTPKKSEHMHESTVRNGRE
ncbi:hypothetical protein B484DRAFT_402914 [Ochromonadaceae sp. CCMP2298]|nr:hypothetical protein B484DRAFT_402914 [Ochromonadaceae sp. CCMP2298]